MGRNRNVGTGQTTVKNSKTENGLDVPANSQKPYPLGFPVSLSKTSLEQTESGKKEKPTKNRT